MNRIIFRPADGVFQLQPLLNNIEHAIRICRMLSNDARLKILCFLADGEKSVSQLKALTKLQQPNVSQQLARLRDDGLVGSRRDGKMMYYTLKHPGMRVVLECLACVAELGSEIPAYSGKWIMNTNEE